MRAHDLQLQWERVSTAIEDARARQINQAASHAQRKVGRAPEAPKVGDMVLLDTRHYQGLRPSKLHAPFIGPFKVLARTSPAVATLELPPTMRIHPTINLDALRPPYTAVADPEARAAPGPVGTTETGEAMWEIDKIVDSRGRGRARQYKIRWRGYGEGQDSWEPASELKRFPGLITLFESTRSVG
jgi:hypothetical protein